MQCIEAFCIKQKTLAVHLPECDQTTAAKIDHQIIAYFITECTIFSSKIYEYMLSFYVAYTGPGSLQIQWAMSWPRPKWGT